VRGNRNEKPLYPDRHHPHPDPPPSKGEGNYRVSGWELNNNFGDGYNKVYGREKEIREREMT
jgi:hypothetical protein